MTSWAFNDIWTGLDVFLSKRAPQTKKQDRPQLHRILPSQPLGNMTSWRRRWWKEVLLAPLIGTLKCVQLVELAVTVTGQSYTHWRTMHRRLPKSKPLLSSSTTANPLQSITGIGAAAKSSTSRPTSFLQLPLEIRLRIYTLVLRAPGIIEPYHDPTLTFFCALPPTWAPGQHIRSDTDPPSTHLRWRSTPADLRPRRQGCVQPPGVPCRILCGDQPVAGRYERAAAVRASHLLRTCRGVYADVMDLLYARNTMSFCCADMVRYFTRNTSPEGLARVRYVHVALIASSSSRRQKKVIEGAMRTVGDAFSGLRQLDVEIVLKNGQPADPQNFWAWLRMDVLGKLRGLEVLVLKVPVYLDTLEAQMHPDYPSRLCALDTLSSWDKDEYRELKTMVMSAK